MRRFLIGWLVAFGLVGLIALGIGAALGSAAPPRAATAGGTSARAFESTDAAEPFTPEAAVDVVAARLAATGRGEEYRRELRQAARVSYHSAQHWTVRWGSASWTAHGPGRYAEPDNDAAREREAEATAGP
jgi:hypothetical protein